MYIKAGERQSEVYLPIYLPTNSDLITTEESLRLVDNGSISEVSLKGRSSNFKYQN
jgi:hypothetical protein